MIRDRHFFAGNQVCSEKVSVPNTMKRRDTQSSPLQAITISLMRFIAKLQGKRYFRTGSCTRCGSCCRNMKLLYKDRTVETLEEFGELVKSDSAFAIFTPSQGNGLLTFTCRHIRANGSCDNYGSRPESCRRYPDAAQIEHYRGDMIEGCGYELHTVEIFEKIFSRELKSR